MRGRTSREEPGFLGRGLLGSSYRMDLDKVTWVGSSVEGTGAPPEFPERKPQCELTPQSHRLLLPRTRAPGTEPVW